jgi:hypothetical protein
MFWKRLFGGGDSTDQPSATPIEPTPLDEVDAQLEAALDWLDDATAAMQAKGIGQFPLWDADIAQRRIRFSNDDGVVLEYVCDAIGTFNREKGSWHWGWDHPSIPLEAASAALAVREFGVQHDLNAFTTRQIAATGDDTWQFAALGGMLTNAFGVYRTPGAVEVFLTIYET